MKRENALSKAEKRDARRARARMAGDLTRGKPLKKIVLFTLPILLGNVIQQLYSMVDAAIVGQTISLNALGSVGLTGAINFLILGFCFGLTGGFSVIVSQFFGAKEEEKLKRSVAASILLCAVISVVMTVVSVLLTKPLLRLMKTPQELFDDAYIYIVIIFYGITAAVYYNMFSCILRAIGDSKTPLYFLIFASLLNVVLDLLFIVVFKTGVAGAAWATVISQALSAALCLVYMFAKYPVLRLKARHFKLSWRFAWRHLRLGLPMALQYSITAVGVMVLQTALNGFGSQTVGAYTAASKIDQLAGQMLMALGSAMATYSGQNYGAGNYDRIRRGVRAGNLFGVAMAIVSGALIILFGRALTGIFISGADDATFRLSQIYLVTNAAFYSVLALLHVYRNTLQGIGRGGVTMFAGVTELVLRSAVAMTAAYYLNYVWVCLSNMAAWVGATVFLMIVYYVVIRKYKGDKPPVERAAPAERENNGDSDTDDEKNGATRKVQKGSPLYSGKGRRGDCAAAENKEELWN